MRLLFYQGLSLPSRVIRFVTRSEYGHVAVELNNGTVVEAWRKGVTNSPNYGTFHTPGTIVDVFEVTSNYDYAKLEAYLLAQVGKKYDFMSVFRFLSKQPPKNNDILFCSEVISEGFIQAEGRLLNGCSALHSPRDLWLTPGIKQVGTWVV